MNDSAGVAELPTSAGDAGVVDDRHQLEALLVQALVHDLLGVCHALLVRYLNARTRTGLAIRHTSRPWERPVLSGTSIMTGGIRSRHSSSSAIFCSAAASLSFRTDLWPRRLPT